MNPNIVLGFHGCSKKDGVSLLNNPGAPILNSVKDYNWLGDGMYFWENDPSRAYDFAIEFNKKDPFVLGAVLYLGECLDLTTQEGISVLKNAYENFLSTAIKMSLSNSVGKRSGITGDLKLRKLDCAVFRALKAFQKDTGLSQYDSVRAGFWEGDELYPTAGFRDKNHIQICIKNPDSILGFFLPRMFQR